MTKTDRLLYPVILAGQGVTLVSLEKLNGRWTLLDFGNPTIAATVATASSQSQAPSGAKPGSGGGSYFAVQIPSLKRLTFVAYSPPIGPGGSAEQKRNVILKATTTSDQLHQMFGSSAASILTSNPHLSLETKGIASANDVFKFLVPEASKVANSNVPPVISIAIF